MELNSDKTPRSVDLYVCLSILRRRWLPFVGVASSVFGLIVVGALLQKPVYEAKGKLLFSKKDRVSSLTDLTNQNREIDGLTQTTNPLDTEAEIIRSVPVAQKAVKTLNLRDRKGQQLNVDQFLRQLKAKGIRGTDVLEVSFRGKSPQEATAAVNLLMQLYLDNNVQVNRAEATAARKFINKQLPEVEARVSQAEAVLQQFKEANQIVDLEEESKVAVLDVSKLSEQATQVQADLLDATERGRSIQTQIGLSPAQAVTATTLSQSKAVQQVLQDYREVQDQLAVQRTRYRDGTPIIDSLLRKEVALHKQLETRISQALGASTQPTSSQDLQLSSLKQDLAEILVKTEADRLGLKIRSLALKAAISSYQSRIQTLPKLEKKQRELDRRLQVARATYEQLLKRFQEVEIAENQNVGNARIVSFALAPEQPISPRQSLNLITGAIIGILSGILTAFVLDAIDKSVKTPEEAQKILGYPLLGVIPLVREKNSAYGQTTSLLLPVRDYPYSSIKTNFEMLQTTLGFTVPDQRLQSILVTSAVAGEGKSFIAANLAIATAQMGRRVLLIDANMRKPVQHLLWQQLNIRGLSDILVEQATMAEVITKVNPNLWLMTAGTIPPNPVALLDSQNFANLIESVCQSYDFVILDTPALNLIPDGLTTGKFVDGILFVVRPQVSDSETVSRAKALLSQTSYRVLGMVINGYSSDPYYSNQDLQQPQIPNDLGVTLLER